MSSGFPSSPINGQTYTVNGISFQYNSTNNIWTIVGQVVVPNLAAPNTYSSNATLSNTDFVRDIRISNSAVSNVNITLPSGVSPGWSTGIISNETSNKTLTITATGSTLDGVANGYISINPTFKAQLYYDTDGWHTCRQDFLNLRLDGSQSLTSAQTNQGLTNLGINNSLLPAGMHGYFFMNSPPTGWIKANGAAISRTVYANLFAAIGTFYGAGDGSTTFNVPDIRGAFVRTWDDGRGLDVNISGRSFGSYEGDAIGSHNHGASASTSVTIYPGAGTLVGYVGAGSGNIGGTGANMYGGGATAGASTSVSIGYAGSSETCVRNYALLGCIKY